MSVLGDIFRVGLQLADAAADGYIHGKTIAVAANSFKPNLQNFSEDELVAIAVSCTMVLEDRGGVISKNKSVLMGSMSALSVHES
jgi:hypothetical protein